MRTEERPFRSLPSTDRVLRSREIADLLESFDRTAVVRLVRRSLHDAREAIERGVPAPDADEVAARVASVARARWKISPDPVINATGVILHTNLGRAPLSFAAREAVARAAAYTDLEIDLTTGKRASRQKHVADMLCDLTGAEAAMVTVNNAAALLLALASTSRGKDVLLARGQAVEIGGGFRVPSILRQSGARLVDVGTTNRTGLDDYEEAIGARTAAILHVHPSNFRVVGFTNEAPLPNLSELARRHGLLLISDNGSGALLDTERFGLAHEPTPMEALEAGADLVTFSGDKLLGGPQCGILLGNRDLISRAVRHPLSRAVRPDKLCLAALAATLLAYLRGTAATELPVWNAITQSPQQLADRAATFQGNVSTLGLEVILETGRSTVGGGSLPGETLPTTTMGLPIDITSALRQGAPAVLAGVRGGRTLLDLRTVPAAQEEDLMFAVIRAVERVGEPKIGVIDSTTR